MSGKRTEQLAEQVVREILRGGVETRLIKAITDGITNNTREATIKALLANEGDTVRERDKEWALQLSGLWTQTAIKPTTPAEVESAIRKHYSAEGLNIRKVAYDNGLNTGFRDGLDKGVRLGWSAHDMGKGLEAALKGAEKVKP